MDEGSVTVWLARLRAGEVDALDRVMPLVYDELRSLARAKIRGEGAGDTLGATGLVHEAYLRLADRERLRPEDRRHFLGIAAQSMRRILIEHARARKRKKRGAGAAGLPLQEVEALLSDEVADELLSLDEALDRLARANPRGARVVEHRFYAGLTLEETAEILGVSQKTVQRDWLLARAWLRKEIRRANPTMTCPLDEIAS